MLQIIRDVALRKETVRSGDKVTKLQSFEDDEVLFEYCTRPEILRYVQCFTGLNVKSCHTSRFARCQRKPRQCRLPTR